MPSAISSLTLLLTLLSAEAVDETPPRKVVRVAAFDRLFLTVGALEAFPRDRLAGSFGEAQPGFQLHFGVGLRALPLAFGIGFHEITLTGESSTSSDTGVFTVDGKVGVGRLHFSRSASVRHFDAFVRLEPGWKYVRPYLELVGGTAQVFADGTVTDSLGTKLGETEDEGHATWAWAYGAGVHFEPWTLAELSTGSLNLEIGLGVRKGAAGALRYQETTPTIIGNMTGLAVSTGEAAYRTIEPYLTIGVVGHP